MDGKIPTKHQLRAENLSGGKLVPDEAAKKEAAELSTLLHVDTRAAA
jgi:hypothetical protein